MEDPVSGYAVVIEQADGNLSAYVPDLPGCVATGSTEREVRTNIAEAIRVHVESLRAHGEPVPPPTSTTASVEVA
jgi:predicted RNase H-like HicB family nuclease